MPDIAALITVLTGGFLTAGLAAWVVAGQISWLLIKLPEYETKLVEKLPTVKFARRTIY